MLRYRRLVLIFLVVPLLAVLAVPLTNIFVRRLPETLKLPWWHRFVLFDMDPAFAALANPLSVLGISVRPGEGYIGYDGWIFLGESHSHSMSLHRDPLTDEGHAKALAQRETLAAWKEWFAVHGVPHVWVVVAPDKEDIYPEHMPRWAVPSPQNLGEDIRATADPAIVIDAVAALRAAKPEVDAPLFYRTDTHWTTLGGRIGVESVMDRLRAADPGLVLPSDPPTRTAKVVPSGNGDLTRLLAITRPLDDFGTEVTPLAGVTAKYSISDAPVPLPGARGSVTLSLYQSDNALNSKTLLFLHDSFGWAMTPDFARLFARTYHASYDSRTLDGMAAVLEQVKPDFVIFELVDRMAQQGPFGRRPPP